MPQGVTINDASNHVRSLVAFEEMLEFLVIRLVSSEQNHGICNSTRFEPRNIKHIESII